MPLAQGDIGVYLSDKRKAGVFTVVSQDLIRATDDTAEATLTGILVRAQPCHRQRIRWYSSSRRRIPARPRGGSYTSYRLQCRCYSVHRGTLPKLACL